MAIKLYFHPLSSFCQKVLIALYENDTPFVPHIVDLGNESSRADFLKVWPLGKFPVLQDSTRDRVIPETSVIIEYLQQYYPGTTSFIPGNPELARQTRFRDRFFDLYVNVPMQKIVTDRLRPSGQSDAFGVEHARAQLKLACEWIEKDMAGKTWAMGDVFSMADCAAAPALYYANLVMPLGATFKNTAAYLQRLMVRPSFARAVQEAEGYRSLFPM